MTNLAEESGEVNQVIPDFNFDTSTTDFMNDEEVQKAVEEDAKGGRLQPGNYELKITGARFNKVCADNDWISLCITLSTADEGSSINIYPLIPAKGKVEYQKPGGKRTMFCWTQTMQFLNSLGLSTKPSQLGKVNKKLFSKTKSITFDKFDEVTQEKVETQGVEYPALLGKTLEVDVGYKDIYIAKVPDSDDFAIYKKGVVVNKKGQDLIGDSFDDCLMLATEYDIEDKISRLEVLKMYPAKVRAAEVSSDLDNI